MLARALSVVGASAVTLGTARSVTARGLAGGPDHVAPVDPLEPAEGFRLVAVHPHAAAQPTADGRSLAALEPWRGLLYAGYGDYGANTGPIHVLAFDPTRQAFTDSLLAANTEAIYGFRPLGDHLYAPAIDPKRQGGYAFAVAGPDGAWSDPAAVGVDAQHAYDAASLTGVDVWVVGSARGAAVAWRSSDGGATWTEMLVQPPVSAVPGDFARFYFAGVLGGELYVQGHDYHGGPHRTSRVFDGAAWRDGPDLLGAHGGIGWHPIAFAGRLVLASWPKPMGGRLMVYDGRDSVVDTGRALYDMAVAEGALWVLDTADTIWRTTDLGSWEAVGAGPPGSRSLALLDRYLYVGTTGAELYRSARPVSAAPGSRLPATNPR